MWFIFFVLPEIQVKQAIGNNLISIAPHDDPRVKECISSSPYAKALSENFKDQFGKPTKPSFLIAVDTILDSLRKTEAVVGFRNAFALSVIAKGHENYLSNQSVVYPPYSDYFDFYPITVNKNNDCFKTWSPALSDYGNNEHKKFRGQTNPSLARKSWILIENDDRLFSLILKAWERRFVKGRTEWSTTALFRSLEMAYRASAMSFANHATVNDYGTSASLWLSALEILSHPRKGKADLLTVLDLLGQFQWNNKSVKKRLYKVMHRQNPYRVNLPQRLYKELYDTRNDFLHGNLLSMNRLHPFRRKDKPIITIFAPLLYKVALLCYLDKRKEKELLHDLSLSKAMLKAVG
jgi:hypothetical protein